MNHEWKKDWEFEVGMPDMWGQHFDGAIIQLDKDLYGYIHLVEKAIVFTVFSHSGFVKEQSCAMERPTIPALWMIEKDGENWIAYCNEQTQFFISSTGLLQQAHIPADRFPKPNPYHFSDDPFCFGRYVIEHKRSFGYMCSNSTTKEKLWDIQVQGYLYADMKLIGNRLFICTAEHGGYVYCFDIQTGNLYYKIKTNGTAKIQFGKDYFVCYVLGEEGKLIVVDIKTGLLLQSVELYKVTLDCPLFFLEDTIIVTVSFKKTRKNEYVGMLTTMSWCHSEKE